MAWNFDETDDAIVIADAAVLTLQGTSAPFAIGGWIKVPNNAGTTRKYLMGWGAYGAAPSFNLTVYEASHATLANVLELNYRGVLFRSPDGTPGADTGWQHIMVTRVAATGLIELWRNAAQLDDLTNTNECNVAGDWYIGARNDLSATLYFGGQMAEWFKMDRELSGRERAALVAGMSPIDLPGIFDATSWYLPMYGGAYVDVMDRISLTVNGSPVAARHPPVRMPFARRQTRRIVADAVTFSPAWAAHPGLVGGVHA